MHVVHCRRNHYERLVTMPSSSAWSGVSEGGEPSLDGGGGLQRGAKKRECMEVEKKMETRPGTGSEIHESGRALLFDEKAS